MPKTDDLPVFPFEPTEVKTSWFRASQYGDFQSEEDIQQLIHLLWLEPECTFYYYYKKNGSIDDALQRTRDRGDILMNEMKRRYFVHPKFERDYIAIFDRGGEYAWD